MVKLNLIGRRFGKLVVIGENSSKKKLSWECRCDCGNTSVVVTSNLTNGHTASCGCERLLHTRKEDFLLKKFGRLLVIEKAANRGIRTAWLCKCECGNNAIVLSSLLKGGKTKSCGCLKAEFIPANKSHGMTETSEYKAWCLMKERCSRVENKNYHRYGGRGIKVCKRWIHSFENFYKDMGSKPTPKHTLDRKNSNKGYSKLNCRWATQKEQQGNRTNNKWHEYNGLTMIQADWARYFGVDEGFIRRRLNTGHSFREVYSEFNKTKTA